MTGDWPEPRPRPLEQLSPSGLSTLLTCGLRSAFERDDAFTSWQRPTTRTSLGAAAHRLTEDVWRGRADGLSGEDFRDWFEQRWQALLEEQEDELRRAWVPGRPPRPADWPGHALTKVRLRRTLEARAPERARPARPQASVAARGPLAAGVPRRLPLVERRLSDPETGLVGVPDRVEETGGRLRVVDLKSGVHQEEVTAAQRRQLLLYAHLVTVELGRTPDDLVVLRVDGTEQAVPWDTAAVAEEVDRALAAKGSWNAAIQRQERVDFLADPSPHACGTCPFRVVCLPYWRAWEPDWRVPAAVAGAVVRDRPLPGGREVTLAQELPPWASAREVRVVGLPPEVSAPVGARLVMTDLDRLGAEAMRARWSTLMRACSG